MEEVDLSSYLDLLTEVEELSTLGLGHGKATQIEFSHCLGDMEEVGVPSLCLPDDLLPEVLFGDPVMPLPLPLDQDTPCPAPPVTPKPQTLMPRSLPAAATPPAPRPATPPLPHPATPPSSPEEDTAAPTDSCPTPPQSPPRPVRVVVRTNTMVAPATINKSTRYLVRIPGPSAPQRPPTPTVIGHKVKVLQRGGKLGPTAAATSNNTLQPSEAPCTPEVSPTSTLTTATTTSPFRSVVHGLRGGTRQTCGGSKRKAYELDPQDDPVMERCRQNAINARRNRELKKAQMAELERRAEEADQERQRLAEENRRLRDDNTRLQREVGHLTGVLKNQSQLSHILEKLAPAGGSRSSRPVGGVHP